MIDNDQSYFEACNPKPIGVCGVLIPRLTVGHIQQLKSIQSSLLTLKWPDLASFLTALWICSNPVKPGLPTFSQILPLRWRIASKFIALIDIFNPKRIDAEKSKLKDFIHDAVFFKPPIANKDIGGRESTCPILTPMKRALMSHYGYSEAEFLNMPFKQARWEYAIWLEHEGAIEFKTRRDEELLERMRSPEMIAANKRFWEERKFLKRNRN